MSAVPIRLDVGLHDVVDHPGLDPNVLKVVRGHEVLQVLEDVLAVLRAVDVREPTGDVRIREEGKRGEEKE